MDIREIQIEDILVGAPILAQKILNLTWVQFCKLNP